MYNSICPAWQQLTPLFVCTFEWMLYCILWSSILFVGFHILRDLLRRTCHGFNKALVSQDNTPVGAQIVYDGEKRKPLTVTSAFFHTFAKVSTYGVCCLFILIGYISLKTLSEDFYSKSCIHVIKGNVICRDLLPHFVSVRHLGIRKNQILQCIRLYSVLSIALYKRYPF